MDLKKYIDRTSVRHFTKDKFSQEEIEILKKVINNSPTSNNQQQFTSIIITDQKLKTWIAKKNWNQEHIKKSAIFIVFIADRTRSIYAQNKKNKKISRKMLDHEFIRIIIDASIAANYTQNALIEMGYGVTCVGGILFYGDELSKKLNIPQTAFPILGLSVGKTSQKTQFKPKMNKVYLNKYDLNDIHLEIEKYEKNTVNYFKKIEKLSWIEKTAIWSDKNSKIGKMSKKAGKFIKNKLKKLK